MTFSEGHTRFALGLGAGDGLNQTVYLQNAINTNHWTQQVMTAVTVSSASFLDTQYDILSVGLSSGRSTEVALDPSIVLEQHRDREGRLHKAGGPALRLDPIKVKYEVTQWWWHGTRVPDHLSWIIEEPETITVWAIERETNAEIRRVMIECYEGKNAAKDGLDGYGRYIRDCGAVEIDREDGIGILWRKEFHAVQTPWGDTTGSDEPIHMVEVLNSTIEPDGSRHRFFLRVPPDTRTARQAVAWTFGLKAKDYRPMVET